MGKSAHFSGQPLYCQVIKLLNELKIIKHGREKGEERYVKCFEVWTHLVVMLYAVIMRFDSLREITTSLQAEARKLSHLGISMMTSRSTLSDVNKRRLESVFEAVYRAYLDHEKFEQMIQRGVIYESTFSYYNHTFLSLLQDFLPLRCSRRYFW